MSRARSFHQKHPPRLPEAASRKLVEVHATGYRRSHLVRPVPIDGLLWTDVDASLPLADVQRPYQFPCEAVDTDGHVRVRLPI